MVKESELIAIVQEGNFFRPVGVGPLVSYHDEFSFTMMDINTKIPIRKVDISKKRPLILEVGK